MSQGDDGDSRKYRNSHGFFLTNYVVENDVSHFVFHSFALYEIVNKCDPQADNLTALLT